MRTTTRSGHPITGIAMALTILGAASCDDSSDGGSGADHAGQPIVVSQPAPADMCAAPEMVAVAAYDLDSGEFRWATCSADPVLRTVVDATDDAVFVEVVSAGFERSMIGLDADDGTELRQGGPEEWPELSSGSATDDYSVVVDGVRIRGSQEGPTISGSDADGVVLWTQPGSLVYDDVYAVGDGAVFVGNSGVAAYEATTGAIRWRAPDAVGYPWYATDEVLFTLWPNLAVYSTDDGALLWRTDYGDTFGMASFPRLMGVGANSDTVFVSFSAMASGGD